MNTLTRGTFGARIRPRLLALVALATVVMLLHPPVVAGADVLGGAPDTTAAPPPQEPPEAKKPSLFEGLQFGDPASGVDLIDPPETDAYGGAQLRHPIELPQGRLNWQPQVALAYDSGAGNGWMGMGWDLSLDAIRVPGLGSDVSADSISVDTRWGVPRYKTDVESETYVFGGEELSPTAHQDPQVNRVAERQFSKRVEGDYLRIIRHGDSPQNYWWEVHDKIGNKYFYGGELDEYRTSDDTRPDPQHPENRGHLVPDATLSKPGGGIYWWGLREKVDISTNSVTYFYDKNETSHHGIGNGTELYLSRINYSGSKLRADQTYAGTEAPLPQPALPRYGRYDVNFVREAGRPDVTSDATGGALHVTSERLTRIDVTFCSQPRPSISPSHPSQATLLACPGDTQLVRQYKFDYQTGPFGKSLLHSVAKADNGSQDFATHTFDYFNEVTQADGSYKGFGDQDNWDLQHVGEGLGGDAFTSLSGSALGASKSFGGDGRLFLGFSLLPIKLLAAGGGMQFGGSDSETVVQFLDINGDGLPDKVWLDGEGVHYQLNRSGAHGTNAFASNAEHADGISSLGNSSEFFVGAGAEAYVAVVALMYNKTWSFSRETTYFNDVNADGRPDLVDGGKVLFNVLDPTDGHIWFTDDSSFTSVRVGGSLPVDPNRVLPDQSATAAAQSGSFPKVDTLRRWTAPWSGVVSILAPVSLAGASVDGVRVTMEKFHGPVKFNDEWHFDAGTPLFSADLQPGDTSKRWPGGIENVPITVPVDKGDHIYFRLQPKENGADDVVVWDPQISYVGAEPTFDVNGKDVFRYSGSEDFTLAGRSGSFVTTPLFGTVRIKGDVVKTRPTSDDVLVVLVGSNTAPDSDKPSNFSLNIPAAQTGTFPIDVSMDVKGSQPVDNPPGKVLPGSQISARLAVDTEIDPSALAWRPTLTYTEAKDAKGQPVRTTDHEGKPMSVDLPVNTDIYPLNDLTAPQKTVHIDRGDTRVWWAHLQVNDADVLPARVVVSVKGRDGMAFKQVITLTQDAHREDYEIKAVAPQDGPYWIDFTFRDPDAAKHIVSWVDDVQDGQSGPGQHGTPEAAAHHWTAPTEDVDRPDVFPVPYRGWAYAGYNGEGDRATANVNEDDLLFRQSDYPDEDDKPTDPGFKNPIHNKAYPFAADAKSGTWVGPKQATKPDDRGYSSQVNQLAKGAVWGGPGRASAARIGLDSPTMTLAAVDSAPHPESRPSHASGPVITGVGDVDALGVGVSVVGVGAGVGEATGKTTGQVDFLDLNGDAYPDVVGEDVYYTNEVGGRTDQRGFSGDVRYDHEFSMNVSSEGSPASISVSATGDTNSEQEAGNPSSASDRAGKGAKGAKSAGGSEGGDSSGGSAGGKGGGGGGTSKKKKSAGNNGGGDGGDDGGGDGGGSKLDVGVDLGISGSLSRSWTNSQDGDKQSLDMLARGDELETDLADINGDGLPDRVNVDHNGNMRVALNLGYSFAPEREWSTDEALEQGTSRGWALGISAGFNIDKFGLSGGVEYSSEDETTDTTWDDVNGDGLPDRLYAHDGHLWVAFNTGTGLAPSIDWGPLEGSDISKSESTGFGGGADFTVTVGPLCWPTFLCYIDINPGFHVDGGWSTTRSQLADVDGDGLIDSVSSQDSNDLKVRRNLTGRTNLLKAVHRPLGATFSLEYGREGNTTDHPDSMWVLTKVTTDDGHKGDGVDTQVTTYRYEGARFDFEEREDYGFRKVVETQVDPATDKPYRVYEQVYRNGNYYERGLLDSETLRDGAGKVLTSTVNTYQFVDSHHPTAGVILSGHDSLTGSVFPRLVKTEDRWHDGAGVAKSTAMEYRYDARGNLVEMTDRGEPGTSDDDVVSQMRFTQCDGPGGDPEFPWTQMPDRMVVRSGSTVLQRREAQVDCNTASVAEVRDYLSETGDDPAQVQVTNVEYLPVGGQTSAIIGPGPRPNPDDGRYGVEYAWDEVGAIPIRTSDSYGQVSTAQWDARMGRLLSKTDANGAKTSYTYDSRGRMTSVTGAMEQGGSTPTISYEYHSEAADPWVLTRHIDPANANSTIDTVAFVDGLGRQIQTKQSGTVAGAAQRIVDGAMDFDAFGRVVAEYYPTTEDLGTPIGKFHDQRDAVEPTRTTYTARDQVATVSEPGARLTTYDYGFGKGPFSTTMFTTLETGPAQKQVRQYGDVRNNIVGVEELHKTPSGAQQNLLTRYGYDPLARLVDVSDPAQRVTHVSYDRLGRRTAVDNPDTGRTEFRYDLNDNLAGEVTANLRAGGKQVTYEYDRTRLKAVRYPDNPANNVTYSYGAPGAPGNAVGRITKLEDGSRTGSRSYDILGEVAEETVTMKVSNLSPQTAPAHTYTSRYRHDTWGRLLSMTYPDGELLSYTYDSGGLATSATGVKEGVTYPYFDGVQYDKAGNRTSLHYGNGLLTQTSYAPDTRWFSDQKVTMGQTTLSDLHYRYDKAGNVLERNDTRPLPPVSDLGGPSAQTFRYDDLHRLTSATGTYMSPPTKKREYSFALTYDDAGRVVNKTQKDQVNGITQKDTTYILGYEYKGAAPHAPSKIGDRNYRFDADGNVTKWTMDKSSVNRAVTWDEADRMTRVTDQSSTTDLRYDDADELAILRGPQGEIEFVNDTFVQHNGAGAWKTVLLNDVPVATKRVDNTPELKQYWMTGDLLDSVNLVTDSNGKLFEHSLYLPSGQMWFWEKSTVYREPFLFAGSWFDEFRGLNSMEARWYEPRDGIMYSPDPILEGDVDEAVLEPRLLGSYTYGFDNPELYVDDSGEQATSNQGAHQATFGHRFRERLTALREKKHRVESEGRVGRFNARIERMQDSRGYEALENVLEGSMVQIELSFDGSLKINPKIMGVGLDDIKKLRKKKAKV